MKKILILMFVLIFVVLSTLNCYAAVPQGGSSKALPLYVGTRDYKAAFTISSSGLATMDAELKPLSTNAIDDVKVTLVIKNGAGTIIYNKSYNATWSNISEVFYVSKKHQLESKGRYTFQATYKCYKNNTLLETIKSELFFRTY